MKIAVLGSGGWGTALAMLLAENGHTVTLWSYLEEESRRLQQTRENPLLPGVTLPESLSYTWDLSCVRGCGVVVMATPSFGVRSTAEGIRGMLTPETILVSVSKGIEKGSSLRMTEIIRQATGDLCPVVALSGPSHAEEVARRVPTAVVSACPDQAAAETVQDLFLNDRFRDGKSYIPFSYFVGASPENGYTPRQPFTLLVGSNHTSNTEEGYCKLFIPCGGADDPRPIKLRRKGNGQWFLWEQYLMTGIRIPTSADPWA